MEPCLVRHALSSTPLSSAGSTSFTPCPLSWPMMARAAPSAASRTACDPSPKQTSSMGRICGGGGGGVGRGVRWGWDAGRRVASRAAPLAAPHTRRRRRRPLTARCASAGQRWALRCRTWITYGSNRRPSLSDRHSNASSEPGNIGVGSGRGSDKGRGHALCVHRTGAFNFQGRQRACRGWERLGRAGGPQGTLPRRFPAGGGAAAGTRAARTRAARRPRPHLRGPRSTPCPRCPP